MTIKVTSMTTVSYVNMETKSDRYILAIKYGKGFYCVDGWMKTPNPEDSDVYKDLTSRRGDYEFLIQPNIS